MILEFAVTACAVLATILNIFKNKYCWFVWMVGGCFWWWLLFKENLWVLFWAEFGWQGMNVLGWVMWNRGITWEDIIRKFKRAR